MKVVRSTSDAFQAELTRGLLESHGIESRVINDLNNNVIPFSGAMPSMQVQVVVSDGDYQRAREVMTADGAFDQQGEPIVTECPLCHSRDIVFGSTWGQKLAACFVFLTTGTLGRMQNHYYCKSCQQEF